MVVLSLVFVLGSSAMLAAGILLGSDLMVGGSIALSITSAALLLYAIRKHPKAEAISPAAPVSNVSPVNPPSYRDTQPYQSASSPDNQQTAFLPNATQPVRQPAASPGPPHHGQSNIDAPGPHGSFTDPAAAHRDRASADDETIMLPALDSVRRRPLESAPVVAAAAAAAAAEQTTVIFDSQPKPPAEQPVQEPHTNESVAVADGDDDSTPPREPAVSTAEPVVVEQQPETEEDYEDPPDEPDPELLLSSEERRILGMSHEVLVVDGRPRYHVAGCAHLADKASQGLPVSEAAELGFSSCSACGAATALLTREV